MTDPVDRLERADEDRQEAKVHVERIGEDSLRTLRQTCTELENLIDRYDETAVGDEDFAAFIEFQERIAQFTERLPDQLLERDTFESIDDLFQQRRLTERDFANARDELAAAKATHKPLDDEEDAIERYRDARGDVNRRLDDVTDEIATLERLQRLGRADLDAPTDHLRGPIETYDESVIDAFRTFKTEAPARDVLDFVTTTALYPLADFRVPPDDVYDFVQHSDAGTEPIPRLLEYADFSWSKLDHYVDDADALKRNVATQQTYLERLTGDPLTVGWPPPEADVLRWQCDERISVVGRFAPDVVADLRDVRALTWRDDYERLRESSVARDELTDEERERLQRGTVEDELRDARTQRKKLEDALETYPER